MWYDNQLKAIPKLIPANAPVMNRALLLLVRRPINCENPSNAIGIILNIKMLKIISTSNRYISRTATRSNSPINNPKYTPKHREQITIGLPAIQKHRSGRWWQMYFIQVRFFWLLDSIIFTPWSINKYFYSIFNNYLNKVLGQR